VLATLGVASAQAMMIACGAPAQSVRRATRERAELRAWLHDAIAILHGAGLTDAHALAVSRRRITAALDVLGGGVARSTCDGLVLSTKGREHVTNDLTRDGILAAARVLAGKAKAAKVDFGRPPGPLPALRPEIDNLGDGQLLARVAAMAGRDREMSSRIVYSAAVLDLDDAHVWSVSAGRDHEQRLVRIRKSITRVAWNGTRPVIGEVTRAWTGGIDDQDLSDDEVVQAREDALALMTPRAFDDGEHACVLEPDVAAALIDAAVHALPATSSPALSIVDDPGAANAYGGYVFDDRGQPARALTLVDAGKTVSRELRRRRPGHVGLLAAQPSHLRVAAGSATQSNLVEEGYQLEGASDASVDPASGRLIVAAARARELAGGRPTGRMYADVELVGEVGAVLTAITGATTDVRTIGKREEVAGQPTWRSIETPWLRTRALLRARRRFA
jgi:predicted Zn-dependent protease